MKYKLYDLSTDQVLDTNNDITPLFTSLKHNQVIIKGKDQEVVAGNPFTLLDIMNRENAHTLPKLKECI